MDQRLQDPWSRVLACTHIAFALGAHEVEGLTFAAHTNAQTVTFGRKCVPSLNQ